MGKVPTDSCVGVWALTYHLLVLLDDHVGIGPQEDVKIQHPSNGPPGQAWSRLQGHLFERKGEEKKVVTTGEQPPDLSPYDGAQAAPQAMLRGIEKSLPCTQQMLNGCLEA